MQTTIQENLVYSPATDIFIEKCKYIRSIIIFGVYWTGTLPHSGVYILPLATFVCDLARLILLVIDH